MTRLREHEPTGYTDINGNMICEGHILYCEPSIYICPVVVEVFWCDDDIWGTDWMFASIDCPLSWREIEDGRPKIIGKNKVLFESSTS